MEHSDSKRTLSDYAHYFFSDADDATHVCAHEKPIGESLDLSSVCALCHSSVTDVPAAVTVLQAGELVESLVDESIVITSPYNKEAVLSQREHRGLRCVRTHPWEVYRSSNGRVQVVIVSEYVLLQTVFSATPEMTSPLDATGVPSRLFLIDSSAFGMDFLDRLGLLYDVVLTIAPLDTAAVLESYQQIKAYAAIQRTFEPVCLVTADTVDKRFDMVKHTLERLGSQHVSMAINIAPLIAGQSGIVKTGESESVLQQVLQATAARRGSRTSEEIYRERLHIFVGTKDSEE